MKILIRILSNLWILSVSCFCQISTAQIVYTDLYDVDLYCNIITAPCSETYKLDLNNDNVKDISFTASYTSCGNAHQGTISVSALNSSEIFMQNGYPARLNWNDSISASAEWSLGGILVKRDLCEGTLIGNWVTGDTRYIGLKLSTDTINYYAWVKLKAASSPTVASLTVYSDAYDSISNEPILAGDTGQIALATADWVSSENLSVYPNPISESAIVSLSLRDLQKTSLKIYNLQGRLIRTLKNEYMSEGPHTITWNVKDENGSEVIPGIYFLKMKTEDQVKTITLSVIK